MAGSGWSLSYRGRSGACLSARSRAAALLAICIFAILLAAAPAAQAGVKAKEGEFGTPVGSGKGQLEGPDGVAVNRTGAGGVSPGDVYVVDGGILSSASTENNRIEEFSASGVFVRAWGMDVVASGPDNINSSAFEVCLPADICKAGTRSEAAGGMSRPEGISIDQVTGTVYVVDADQNGSLTNSRVDVYSAKGEFEGAFGWDVNAATPEEKLQFCTTATGCQKGSSGGGAGQISGGSRSLPAVDPSTGHLYVPEGGGGGVGNFRIEEFSPTFTGSEVTGVNFVKAIGWDVVASGPDQADETQLVTVKAGAGKFKLKYKTASTGELEFNATATEVQTALSALSTITSDGFTVTVSGGPGNPSGSTPYKVVFHGSPKGKNAEPLVGVKVGLSGGSGESSVKVETYNDGGEGLESCVAARGDVCKAGVEGPKNTESEKPKLGQFGSSNPSSVAVDSSGALYAVNQADEFPHGPSRVFKFTFPAAGEVEATEFAPGILTQDSGSPEAVSPTDVAVDPTDDNVVVAKKEGVGNYKFLEFDSGGNLLFESPLGAGLPVSSGGGLAIGTAERFYLTDHEGGVAILGPPPPPSPVEMKPVNPAEVGVTTATFEGKVTMALGPEGEHFPTGYHFEYSTDHFVTFSRFPASDVAIGDGHAGGVSTTCPTPEAAICEVKQEVTGLVPGAEYEVRLVASNGTPSPESNRVSFTAKAASPTVSETVAKQITQTLAQLTAQVNPNNQATTYHFEWATQEEFEEGEYGHETPETPIGSGGVAIEATATIEGLEEGAAYHFRAVATNAAEEETVGPDQEFTTLDSFGLPEGRAPEQVSPNDKRPVGRVDQLLEGQIRYQASADGNSIVYPLLNGLEDATAGGNVEYLGARGAAGWGSTQLTPPSLISPIAVGIGEDATGKVKYASADLSCQLIESPEPLGTITPELEEDVANGVNNLFRRNANGTYTLLTPKPINFGAHGNYHIDWASADCNHILFDTGYRYPQMVPEAPVSTPGLYQWDSGTLSLAAIRPDGSGAEGAVAGLGEVLTAPGDGGSFTNWNSMSADGSKVFFTAKSNEGNDADEEAIFVRKDGAETVDASQSQTGSVDQGARYAMASTDGSQLFFVANYGLATGGTSTGAASCSSAAGGGDGTGCDLYDFNTETEVLSDLSADGNASDAKGASAVGVLDASNDGSHVYFAARGQLVARKGKTEAENLQGSGTYNVYLSNNGALSYVGLIASADANKHALSGGDLSFTFGLWAADATPDGSHLLFVSKANVTGYVSGGATEVYLYSEAAGKTTCLSCREGGQPSIAGAGAPPLKLVTREPFPSFTDVQNRPRSISDDGRHVFFTSPDDLAPGAREGTHNIYEWSSGQLYLLAAGEEGIKGFTEYEDSSPSGKDAFLVTKAKLAPQDFDNTTDLYDLRAPHVPGEKVGPGPPSPPQHICNPLVGEECQGGPPPPESPPGPPPASEGFNGPGNPAPQKAKKPPHRKSKKHKGGKHKKHRHDKRRAAR